MIKEIQHYTLSTAVVILLVGSLNVRAGAGHSGHEHAPKKQTVEEAPASSYPLTTCVVSGEDLEDGFKTITYKGQEVRLCCNSCKKDFYKDPETYMKKLKSGEDTYPLATCVISGEKLGEMGEPYVFNYQGQEVRFCCKMCKKDFLKNPKESLAKIKAGKNDAKASQSSEHHGHSGHHH